MSQIRARSFSLNGSGYRVANNIVSDNAEGGIDLTGSDDLISDNTVDDNGGEGIAVHSGTQDEISGNVIYSNQGDGLFLDIGVTGTSVDSNQIGLDPNGDAFGNIGNGIVVNDSSNVFSQNTIWYNQAEGIVVLGGIHNTITENSIYLNSSLGIDLGGKGIYPIHSQPEDGPNVFENYPTLTGVIVAGDTATVSGTIDTGPNTPGLPISLEFFLSQSEDPSGYGQGQNWVATATISATGDVVPFSFDLPWKPSLGTWYSATATPQQTAGSPPGNLPSDVGSTSAFSNAMGNGETGLCNGGFETGDFTCWTVSGNDTGDMLVAKGNAHSGTYSAELGSIGGLGFLSQTVSTIPGQTYQLTFWLAHDRPYAGTENEFQVSIGGNVVFDQTNMGNFGYTQYTFDYTATEATTTITFGAREDPSFFDLDDVAFQMVG